MQLIRYEIHDSKGKRRGAVNAVIYSNLDFQKACEILKIPFRSCDPSKIDENDVDWDMPYPNLPEGEYLFYFTPKGNNFFKGHHPNYSATYIEAFAAALNCGGQLVELHKEYAPNDPLIVYEDDIQVAYLANQ